MTIEEVIHYEVTNDATIAALVVGRCYPLRMPQNPTLPNVVYQLVSESPLQVCSYVDPRFQLSCWAETYKGAVTLATAVRTLFEGRHVTAGGVHYRSVVVNEMDTDPDELTGYYRRLVDVKLLHRKL